LAADPSSLVRTAAIEGLDRVLGPSADPTLVDQLTAEDPNLVRTAALLLDGQDAGQAVPALLAALERFTDAERETFRDARVALLGAVGRLGGPADSPDVDPYRFDRDPLVAQQAAGILERWSGSPVQAEPSPPLPRLASPDADELIRLSRIRVVLEMEGGGEVEIVLLPLIAPTNAARFASRAGRGDFDGLTFHRVVANFIIQGGSPGANEYWGDGPYTRDELDTLGQWRGTVGLSTRGRDTGDGQIYVNLVDNVRLDSDYTIFGSVSRGMDVVDGVLEGAVTRRARVVEGG
jgi:cyclophilin family peptidyl-prolyl cis-trans isomerase